MTLNIVHFSTADREGGSARAARRIHAGLRARGHRSRMLVKYITADDDPDVDTVSGWRWLRLADRAVDAVTRRLGWQYLYFPSEHRLVRHPWLRSPDIIQLYNIHGGYFATRMLPWLATKAPIVWRLSDLWPITGHCAYAGACERWLVGCGECPDLGTYPPIGRDATAFLWRQKKALYARVRPTIVAPSSWIEGLARQSPLLAGCDFHRIPNGLDQTIFHPASRKAARQALGLDQHKRVVLFSAHVADANLRKGTDALMAALQELGPRDDLVLAVAGINAERWVGRVPQDVVPLGYLRDDRALAATYAAADFVVVPSAVENFPNSLIEAFSCGRTAVAFDVGGIRDAVRNGETGLLVPAGDIRQLAVAVGQLVDDPGLCERLGSVAADLAKREYSLDVQTARFEALYLDVMARTRR